MRKKKKKKNRMSLLQLCVQSLSLNDAKRKKKLSLEKRKLNQLNHQLFLEIIRKQTKMQSAKLIEIFVYRKKKKKLTSVATQVCIVFSTEEVTMKAPKIIQFSIIFKSVAFETTYLLNLS